MKIFSSHIFESLFPSATYALTERSDAFELKLALPGINKEDLKIEAEGRLLKIEAQSKEEGLEWSFSKSFWLPHGTENDRLSASLENGILKMNLPKSEHSKPKLIPVK